MTIRSAGAAKEIKVLISDSVDKIEQGSKLVDEAGKTMNEIVSNVQHVADIMSEITVASQEQSAGIEQVNSQIGPRIDSRHNKIGRLTHHVPQANAYTVGW